MRKQVFISSTYKDLIPHRNDIWEMLESYNLDISGMEKFGARPEKPLATCLKEVEGSNLFIGIVGMRYGSIDKATGKSFSQLEYEKAKELNIDILIYLIDEKNANIVPDLIDFENHSKLKTFKSSLRKNHTIDTYVEAIDLVKKIKNKLDNSLDDKDKLSGYRPKKISAKVENTTINGEDSIVVLGYRYHLPHELYVGSTEASSFSMIRYIDEGWIVKSKSPDGSVRFDFQYEDSHGYTTTIEGLSRLNSVMTNLISKLLEKGISTKVVIEILNETDFMDDEANSETKMAIIKILEKA